MDTTRRVAAWSMLGFTIAFVATFTVNLALNLFVEAPEYPLASEMQARNWDGIVFLLLWGCAGIALVVVSSALGCVVWPDGDLAARISTTFGAIAAGGWIFSGAAVFAQRTSLLNGNIAAAGADPAAERAVVEGLFVLVHVGGILFAFAALPWIGMVAVAAARRARLSHFSIGLLWVAAVAPLFGFLVTGAQYGVFGTVLAFGILGLLLLRRRGVPAADRARSAASATAA